MKGKMDYIRWPADPVEHIVRAYEAGFFIEALQVLHGFLESQLRDFLMVSQHGNSKRSRLEIWDDTQELNFNVLAKTLFIIGKITRTDYNALRQFNRARNNLIHKLFWEPCDLDYKGVQKDEYDRAFHSGLALITKLQSKAGAILGRRKLRFIR